MQCGTPEDVWGVLFDTFESVLKEVDRDSKALLVSHNTVCNSNDNPSQSKAIPLLHTISRFLFAIDTCSRVARLCKPPEDAKSARIPIQRYLPVWDAIGLS